MKGHGHIADRSTVICGPKTCGPCLLNMYYCRKWIIIYWQKKIIN